MGGEPQFAYPLGKLDSCKMIRIKYSFVVAVSRQELLDAKGFISSDNAKLSEKFLQMEISLS